MEGCKLRNFKVRVKRSFPDGIMEVAPCLLFFGKPFPTYLNPSDACLVHDADHHRSWTPVVINKSAENSHLVEYINFFNFFWDSCAVGIGAKSQKAETVSEPNHIHSLWAIA